MLKLSWRQAAGWRARRHHLDKRAAPGSLLAVAARLCGLHAQVMSCAELTAWARVEGLKRGAIADALWEQRTLVKTWAMRGTLHLLPSSEISLWHAVMATSRRYDKPAQWKKHFGITMEELEQLSERVARTLEGRLLTREELLSDLREAGYKIIESSWGTILKPAAFTGRLCFAPSLGQRVRFTQPASWLGGLGGAVETEVAIAQAARRYLAAYSPATTRDLARWWNGSGMTAAKQWIAALGDEVAAVDLEGAQAWMLKAHARQARDAELTRSVRLLPGFDPYVVAASAHADRLMPEGLRKRVYRPQGWISAVLLVNGRMEGIWRHKIQGSRAVVTVEPFGRQPSWVRRGAEEEAERLAAFLGCGLELDWRRQGKKPEQSQV